MNNNLRAYIGQGHNHFVDHISSQISARSAKEDAIIDAESDSHDKESHQMNNRMKYLPNPSIGKTATIKAEKEMHEKQNPNATPDLNNQ